MNEQKIICYSKAYPFQYCRTRPQFLPTEASLRFDKLYFRPALKINGSRD